MSFGLWYHARPGAKKLPGDIGFQVGGPRCSRFREFWNAISAFVQINVFTISENTHILVLLCRAR